MEVIDEGLTEEVASKDKEKSATLRLGVEICLDACPPPIIRGKEQE